MLKAIETHYNGYRFRSRLEARWAVFFDTLGIPYDYEPEGYDLGDAGYYLPDFWLPQQKMWVEIKPAGRYYDAKYAALAKGSGNILLHVVGRPRLGMYDVFIYGPEVCTRSEGYVFAEDRRVDSVWFLVMNDGEDGWTELPIPIHDPIDYWDNDRYLAKHPVTESDSLIRAYNAASGARFEHGETPRAGAA